jgi:hypothetical protein
MSVLTIPLGTHFQFRSLGAEVLAAVRVTMPHRPGRARRFWLRANGKRPSVDGSDGHRLVGAAPLRHHGFRNSVVGFHSRSVDKSGCARVASIRVGMARPARTAREIIQISNVFASSRQLLICGLPVRFRPGSPFFLVSFDVLLLAVRFDTLTDTLTPRSSKRTTDSGQSPSLQHSKLGNEQHVTLSACRTLCRIILNGLIRS